MATLDRAIKFDPTNGQALANKGEVLCELGNFEEAGAALDQAIGLDPSYTHADARAVSERIKSWGDSRIGFDLLEGSRRGRGRRGWRFPTIFANALWGGGGKGAGGARRRQEVWGSAPPGWGVGWGAQEQGGGPRRRGGGGMVVRVVSGPSGPTGRARLGGGGIRRRGIPEHVIGDSGAHVSCPLCWGAFESDERSCLTTDRPPRLGGGCRESGGIIRLLRSLPRRGAAGGEGGKRGDEMMGDGSRPPRRTRVLIDDSRIILLRCVHCSGNGYRPRQWSRRSRLKIFSIAR